MKKESGFVKAKLILRGGEGVFSHTPGTQASKNISVSIGLKWLINLNALENTTP